MNSSEIKTELSVKMLDLEKAIDMGLPYPELKKIYTEVKELQLLAAVTEAKETPSRHSDFILE